MECAHAPCLCIILKLEMKLELLKRLDNSKEGGAEGARLVEQQDPQLDGGDNAAQPGKELVGQQLHQHNHGGGAAAPKGRVENKVKTGEEKPVWCRGEDQIQEGSLKPSDILRKERSSKRKWTDNNMECTADARPKSRGKTTPTTRSGTETTPTIAHWLKETTRPIKTFKHKIPQERQHQSLQPTQLVGEDQHCKMQRQHQQHQQHGEWRQRQGP